MKRIALLFPLICAAAPATPPARQRIVLLVDEMKAIRNFPVVLAERLGYLEAVTVMNIRDDASTAEMLTDSRVDAVMAYYHHTVVARAAGRDFEAVVTLGVTPGVKVLVANHARDKYKTPTDLEFYLFNQIEGQRVDWRSTTQYQRRTADTKCLLRLEAANVRGPHGFCD